MIQTNWSTQTWGRVKVIQSNCYSTPQRNRLDHGLGYGVQREMIDQVGFHTCLKQASTRLGGNIFLQ